MILDALDADVELNRHSTIVIIGGGVAGITLARKLSARNRVLVLESGGLSGAPSVQALYEGDVAGLDYSLTSTRLRFLGGTSNHWGGWCGHFDDADFSQDRLFTRAAAKDARIGPQLAMSGHFEFGPARRAVNITSDADATQIAERWKCGEQAAGWATYWNSVYAHLLGQLEQDAELNSAVQLVKYESLCRNPERILCELIDHAWLDPQQAESITAGFSERISKPDYYKPAFTKAERRQISDITAKTATTLGYDV